MKRQLKGNVNVKGISNFVFLCGGNDINDDGVGNSNNGSDDGSDDSNSNNKIEAWVLVKVVTTAVVMQ